jgi:hypothetical protein
LECLHGLPRPTSRPVRDGGATLAKRLVLRQALSVPGRPGPDGTDQLRDTSEPNRWLGDGDVLLRAVDRLSDWKRGEERAPHKPLLLLLALARIQRGEPRLMRFADIDSDLKKLLRDSGPREPAYIPSTPSSGCRATGCGRFPAPPT